MNVKDVCHQKFVDFLDIINRKRTIVLLNQAILSQVTDDSMA